MATVYDLTHPIEENMTLYPGTPAPTIRPRATLSNEGYRELQFQLTTHTGTHVDAPAHILPHGRTLDQMPPDRWLGNAVVLDVSQLSLITRSWLERQWSKWDETHFILLNSGWHRKWKTSEYLEDYPVLEPAAATWLVEQGIRGIGMDYISVDAFHDAALPNHHILLEAEVLIIENLVYPRDTPIRETVRFGCFPIKIRKADGGPVRALLWQ